MIEKPKGKMGGRRPGAGRKPDYLKRLGLTPLTAAQHLARHDEGKIWDALLHHKSPDVRLKTLIYLTDRRDGKPKQAIDLSGTLNHRQFPTVTLALLAYRMRNWQRSMDSRASYCRPCRMCQKISRNQRASRPKS